MTSSRPASTPSTADAAAILFFNEAFGSRYRNPFPNTADPISGEALSSASGYEPSRLALSQATINKEVYTANALLSPGFNPLEGIKQLYALLFSGKTRMIVDVCDGVYEEISPIVGEAQIYLLETDGGTTEVKSRKKPASTFLNHARAIVVCEGKMVGYARVMCSFCPSPRNVVPFVSVKDLYKLATAPARA